MLKALLVLVPYLLAAPVAAAPALIERDAVCSDAGTETAYVTATVAEHAGAASASISARKPAASPSSNVAVPVSSSNTHPPAANSSGYGSDYGRGSYENTLYFTNWFVSPAPVLDLWCLIVCRGIYGANFQPQQLPGDKVTRILYAFADIGSDGEV